MPEKCAAEVGVAVHMVAPVLDQVMETEAPKGTLFAEAERVRVGPVGFSGEGGEAGFVAGVCGGEVGDAWAIWGA
jgi:hypothetical protein